MEPVPINSGTGNISQGNSTNLANPLQASVNSVATTQIPSEPQSFTIPGQATSSAPQAPFQQANQPFTPQPQPPFQPNPYGYGYPQYPPTMPYMPPMGMGYPMGMMPFGMGMMGNNQKKKVGIFGGFIMPAIILIAIVIASFYGYNYMKVTSTTKITKAQITNEPTEDATKNATSDVTENTKDTDTSSIEGTTEKTEITTSAEEPKVETQKVSR